MVACFFIPAIDPIAVRFMNKRVHYRTALSRNRSLLPNNGYSHLIYIALFFSLLRFLARIM